MNIFKFHERFIIKNKTKCKDVINKLSYLTPNKKQKNRKEREERQQNKKFIYF